MGQVNDILEDTKVNNNREIIIRLSSNIFRNNYDKLDVSIWIPYL